MNQETSSVPAIKNDQIMKQLTRTGSLVDHYRICHNILNSPGIDAHILAWVFIYIRLFSIKDIKQAMRSNYQTKDISHIQNELSLALAKVYTDTFSNNDCDKSLARVLIRNIFNFTPRGGGNGDELRLFILDMMRRHGIKEGHRPGIDDPFLEEWHQKLHSCCTPEDIGICEAYILFQETNSHDLFYKSLWDRKGISVDYLKNMPRPLRHAPRYMPQLIPDLKHMLWILKQIHGGSNNFHYLLEVSRWQLDKELFSMLEDVRDNFGAWWIPGKIVECRQRLKGILQDHCPRDPLMIDVALDNIYKASIEQIDLRTLSGDDIIALILLSLQNIQLSCDNEKISSCIDLWNRIKNAPERDKWSLEWSMQAFAALTYIQSIIHSYMDELYEYIQTKARLLGESCGIPESYLTNFTEEIIRSQNTFVLSKLMDALFPVLLKTAHIGPWKIISYGKNGRTNGIIKKIDSLLSIQGCQFEKPHIMLSEKIDGIEDIPNWATAIITISDVDILSHIAIRCRNAQVILCTCYEHAEFEKLASYDGKTLTVEIQKGSINYHEDNLEKIGTSIHLKKRAPNNNGCSKSVNLLKIEKKVSDFIKIPFSVTLSFEAFEKTLRNNREACNLFGKLTGDLASRHQDYSSILSEIRTLINNLTLPSDIIQEIRERITSRDGMAGRWPDSLEKAIVSNIKKVWGSAWNERAYLSRFSRNLNKKPIRMGVLIQNVIPADYSFIIHTKNPLSNTDNEILSEIVLGLGETLTGNSPGMPLCVVSNKKEQTHRIKSYPSKQLAYFDSDNDDSYIIRSDSNDEDLSDFTGAGLYDSYLTNKPVHTFVKYDKEKLFWDKKFQYFMFNSFIKIAEEIEGIMKCPQDIEGIYAYDSFYIVQTRNLPQQF